VRLQSRITQFTNKLHSSRNFHSRNLCIKLPMLSQTHVLSSRPFSFNRFSMPTKMAVITSRAPFSVRVSTSTTSTPLAGDTIPALVMSEQQTPNLQSRVAAAPSIAVARNLGFRPTPELGLLSHLFVLSMVML